VFAVAGMQLDAGVSVLVESNFDSRTEAAPLRRLADEHDVRAVQVHIGGDTNALVAKFVARARSGKRHPGHGDEPSDAADLRAKIEAGLWEPLQIPGTLVEADMEDEPAAVVRRVRETLER
jgi:predicted kinase